MSSKTQALEEQIQILTKILKKHENKFCADCKRPSPSWASTNLGVFVCINCSGCHRQLGVHITKIKSMNLDLWPKNIIKNFEKINNKIANTYWEYSLKNFDFTSIQNDKSSLFTFIQNKYERKKWVNKKKKDPMMLIIEGERESESDNSDKEQNEEDEEEENQKKKKKKKEKEKKSKNIKEESKYIDNKIESKPTNNEDLFNFNIQSMPSQSQSNINVMNNNLNANNNIMNQPQQQVKNQDSQINQGSNTNLLDVFNVETEEDQKSKKLLNSLQQAYTQNNAQPINQLNNQCYNFFNNMNIPQGGLNINMINPMGMNMNMGMNYNNMMGFQNSINNFPNQMQGNWNNQFIQTNNNYINNYNPQFQIPINLNNNNNINNTEQNYKNSNRHTKSSSHYEFSLNNLGKTTGITRRKSKEDPFADLVSFK